MILPILQIKNLSPGGEAKLLIPRHQLESGRTRYEPDGLIMKLALIVTVQLRHLAAELGWSRTWWQRGEP